jgi:hypothetical protein
VNRYWDWDWIAAAADAVLVFLWLGTSVDENCGSDPDRWQCFVRDVASEALLVIVLVTICLGAYQTASWARRRPPH